MAEISPFNAQLNNYSSVTGCLFSIISIPILIVYCYRNQINGYIFKGTLFKAITATLYFANEAIAFEILRHVLDEPDDIHEMNLACDRQNVISMILIQIGSICLIVMKLNIIPNISKCIRWTIYIFCVFLFIITAMTAKGEVRNITHSSHQHYVCLNEFPAANVGAFLITNMILLVLGLYIAQKRSTMEIFILSIFVITISIVISCGALVVYYYLKIMPTAFAAIDHLSIASKCVIYLYYGDVSITSTPTAPSPTPDNTPSLSDDSIDDGLEYSYSHNSSRIIE